MILKYSTLILWVGLITRWDSCNSFHSPIIQNIISKSNKSIGSLRSINGNPIDCVDCPEDIVTPDLQDVTASKLRDVQLSDSKGLSFTLGKKIGSKKSIVVFLRHLA